MKFYFFISLGIKNPQCLVQYSTVYSTVQCTVRCTVQYSTLPQPVSTLAKNYFDTSHSFSRRVLSARCPSHDVTVTTVTAVGRDVQLSAPNVRLFNHRVA